MAIKLMCITLAIPTKSLIEGGKSQNSSLIEGTF